MTEITWQTDLDVIVVGYGAAGAVAAISAHDAGARVAILERQESETPVSNSLMSGGLFICPNNIQRAIQYMEALYKINASEYWTDLPIIRKWAEYTFENCSWLKKMGVEPELHRRGAQHKFPGQEAIDIYRVPGMGPGLMRLLYGQVKQRGIPVIRGIRATNLLLNHNGDVVGVKALEKRDNEKLLEIRAKRAVILASGGFEFNEQLKLQFLRVYPFYFDAAPWNTGDGIKMACEAGAQLWHMNCCAGAFTLKIPGDAGGALPVFGGKHWISPADAAYLSNDGGWQSRHQSDKTPVAGYVLTDRSGRRYANENVSSHTFSYELGLFDSHKLIYPRVPTYWIMDQKRIDDGPLARPRKTQAQSIQGMYRWSSDNSEEIKNGYIKQAKTIRELAAVLGLPPETLESTVNTYNGYCAGEHDNEFDREAMTLIPLVNPPYYAIELWPGGLNTQGGPRRNENAQVLRIDGTAIPHLYSNGELGSMYGMIYPGSGGNLAECFAFGRIAGENAAACKPI